MNQADSVALGGHERPGHPEETDVGRTDPALELQATLALLRLGEDGALPEELSAVVEFCEQHGLAVWDASAERCSVTFSATAAAIESAFGVELIDVGRGDKRYRRFGAEPRIPTELQEAVVGVFGLRSRPIAQKSRLHHDGSTSPFWTVRELAEAYGFPTEADGSGQTIGLIELGGGFHQEDIDAFFAELGLPTPRITFVSVDGAGNQPAPAEAIRQWKDAVDGKVAIESLDPQMLCDAQATVEVTMDIELAGALAPGAELVVYMAPGTEQGMFNALGRAVSRELPAVDVISMSWGEAEPRFSDACLLAIGDVLATAARQGITVCASAGDAGSQNDSPDEFPCVNFPASNPFVLACGGSTVLSYSAKVDEEAWNCKVHGIAAATGGGVSRKFERPDWQSGHAVPLAPTFFAGRGVPDVAGPADPHTGCAILAGGVRCSSAGTSAVAPMWAALVARCNQLRQRRCGHVNPLLYRAAQANRRSPLRHIARGTNGEYHAAAGWNPCTGLGSPDGRKLVEVLLAEEDSRPPRPASQ